MFHFIHSHALTKKFHVMSLLILTQPNSYFLFSSIIWILIKTCVFFVGSHQWSDPTRKWDLTKVWCWFVYYESKTINSGFPFPRLWQRFHSIELHVVVFIVEINSGKLQRWHITWIKTRLSLMARTRWLLFSCPCKMKLASSQKGIRL